MAVKEFFVRTIGVSSVDAAGGFDLKIDATGTALTANRQLLIDVNNSDRTLTFGGNLTLASSFTTAGAFALTLTTTGTTSLTLPALTDTLVSRTSTDTLTNKTISTGSTWNGNSIDVAYGGTGQTSALTPGSIIYGASSSAMGFTAAGANGQFLKSNAAGTPTWATLTMANIPGATFKLSTTVATSGNLTATYNNGAKTLTNSGTQVAIAIDGVTLSVNNRVLVKDQTDPVQNGIYYVTNVGSGSTNWVLKRATDADGSTEIGAALVAVDQGTVHGGELWSTTFMSTGVLGTDPMLWYEILDSGSSQTLMNKTIGSGSVWNGGTVGVAYGGTGVATITGIVKGNGASAFTAAVAGTDYQAPLVSGTNIKTVNSTSLLGSGNVVTNTITTSTTAPSTPIAGDVWVDSTSGIQYVYTYDGNSSQWVEYGTSGGIVEVAWAIATANYSANTGDKVYCNTTGGPFTVSLPTSPITGGEVTIKAGPFAQTNALTIGRNGSTIMGLSEDMTVTGNNTTLTLVYDGTTWRL